jgi:hypothetical protein
MATNTTNSSTHTSTERFLAVPMSDDDFDICTPLLRRLAHAKIIHASSYEETMSAATISYIKRPDEETPPRSSEIADQVEETSVLG